MLRKIDYRPKNILANGIIIHRFSRFVTAERQKFKIIDATTPGLDIRFVFDNPNRTISKTSKTTYAIWCDDHGFPCAAKEVPQSWIDEPVNQNSIDAIASLKAKKDTAA